jgi:hypothetical protein
MKKVILLLLLMPCPLFGQIVQNFEHDSINSWVPGAEGRWKADTAWSLSGRFSLHHVYDNPDAGTDFIGLPLKGFYPAEGAVKWTFLLRHGYDPSSLNKWSVLLMSDTEPSVMSDEDVINGFAVGVNLTGSDDSLRLSKVKAGVITTVASFGLDWQTEIGSSTPVKISVKRTPAGLWTVEVARISGEVIGSGSGTDPELFSPSWFDISYTYSSTRDRLLWFDDLSIEGVFHQDTVPPEITGCIVSGKSSAHILLSEKPSNEFISPLNFSLEEAGNTVVSIKRLSDLNFRIEFENQFENKKQLHLHVKSLCDNTGNCNIGATIAFTPVWAETGDIIITEIMADPFPEVALPGKEYVELKNNTQYPLNMNKWKLSGRDQGGSFPDMTLSPSGYLIVCSLYDTSLFSRYGMVAGIKSFPTLTDGGTVLYLSDSLGNFIHGVEYSAAWYGNELKSGGGWSIEITDTDYPFYYEGNWTASRSRSGGTPGAINSTAGKNPDREFYGISNVFAFDSLNITLTFSEPVPDTSQILKSLRIDGKSISEISPADPLFRQFLVQSPEKLIHNRTYLIDFPVAIKDFAGNRMEKDSFEFGLTEPALPGDILFNELLFNPLPGDPDYIEFYNNSPKIIDVSRLQVVSVNDQTGDTSQLSSLSEVNRCFLPGKYYAVTTGREKLIERYFSSDPENVFGTGSLPSMTDGEGHLILFNRELDVIDEVKYSEKMHYPLLEVFEGVAIEKTSPAGNSLEASNWHSASESSGWGTPGLQNSVYPDLPETSGRVVLSSSKITPDGDGNEDLLVITLHPEGNDNVVSVTVFDETGSFVKKIASNYLAGAEAVFTWDGTAGDGSPVNTGIYIILINLYNDKGKMEKWKRVCTIIRK